MSGVGAATPQVPVPQPAAQASGLKDLMRTVLAARPAVAQAQSTAAANLSAHLEHFDAYL